MAAAKLHIEASEVRSTPGPLGPSAWGEPAGTTVSATDRPATRLAGWERIRAAAVLLAVAALIGGAGAGALGLLVWGVAALLHHAASN